MPPQAASASPCPQLPAPPWRARGRGGLEVPGDVGQLTTELHLLVQSQQVVDVGVLAAVVRAQLEGELYGVDVRPGAGSRQHPDSDARYAQLLQRSTPGVPVD